MYGHPGKKLMFMGCEFGQWREWTHDESLDWHLCAYPNHQGLKRLVQDLNTLMRHQPAMSHFDADWRGFEWVDCNDAHANTILFLRRSENAADTLLFACNFSPVPRQGYRVGVPEGGCWEEILNTDASLYGGSNCGNAGGIEARDYATHGRPATLELTLPPLGVVVLKRQP
jgi:1,4-alpha-glucan branching enzyme